MWPISEKPRPEAPDYVKVRMPGRPKKNARRREDHEKPVGKKRANMALLLFVQCVALQATTSLVARRIQRRARKNAHLVKAAKKIKSTEVI